MSICVKPNPDKEVNGEPLKVRLQFTEEYLPPEGKNVPHNIYWVRRLRDGDVVKVNAPEEEKEATSTDEEGNSGPQPPEDPQPLSLKEAIQQCLQIGDDEHLTKSGLPDCNILSRLTSQQVTAAMREEAMAEDGDN